MTLLWSVALGFAFGFRDVLAPRCRSTGERTVPLRGTTGIRTSRRRLGPSQGAGNGRLQMHASTPVT